MGVDALPIQVDVRNDEQVKHMVKQIDKRYEKLDVLINNAGALCWKSIEETPIEKYDLINSINSRASFHISKECIPLMKRYGGRIIMHSPPLSFNDIESKKYLENKIGYMISKWGMTMTAMGISEEYKNKVITANTIWPMTPIESFAVKKII